MKSKFLALSLAVASLGFANAADIEIVDIYAKATPPGAKNTALFFQNRAFLFSLTYKVFL